MRGLSRLARATKPTSVAQAQFRGASRNLFTGPKRRGRFVGWTLAGLAFGGVTLWYASDSRAGVHRYVCIDRSSQKSIRTLAEADCAWGIRWLVVPVIHALTADDPEKAHKWSIAMLASGFAPKDQGQDDSRLAFKVLYCPVSVCVRE